MLRAVLVNARNGVNALWAICFGITLIYLIIAAYYNVPMMYRGGALHEREQACRAL